MEHAQKVVRIQGHVSGDRLLFEVGEGLKTRLCAESVYWMSNSPDTHMSGELGYNNHRNVPTEHTPKTSHAATSRLAFVAPNTFQVAIASKTIARYEQLKEERKKKPVSIPQSLKGSLTEFTELLLSDQSGDHYLLPALLLDENAFSKEDIYYQLKVQGSHITQEQSALIQYVDKQFSALKQNELCLRLGSTISWPVADNKLAWNVEQEIPKAVVVLDYEEAPKSDDEEAGERRLLLTAISFKITWLDKLRKLHKTIKDKLPHAALKLETEEEESKVEDFEVRYSFDDGDEVFVYTTEEKQGGWYTQERKQMALEPHAESDEHEPEHAEEEETPSNFTGGTFYIDLFPAGVDPGSHNVLEVYCCCD